MAFFFQVHRIGRGILAGEDEVAFVSDNPLDGFAFLKLHGLGHGGGKVNIPLLTGFALNELNFGRKSHGWIY